MPTSPFTVLIADNQPIFVEGLLAVLSKAPDIAVSAVLTHEGQLPEALALYKPAVLITERHLPDLSDRADLSMETTSSGQTEVLVMSNLLSEYVIHELLHAGVKGLLSKYCSPDELLTAIRKLARHEFYFPKNISLRMLKMLGRKTGGEDGPEKLPHFSEAEKEVITLICRECGSKEIARLLQISIRAVESTRKRIQLKIGCRNMAGIVVFAMQNGLYPGAGF